MSITQSLNRRNGVLSVIQQDVKRRSVELYIRATEKRSTTKEATEEVHWRMCQLGLLVVQQIGVDNLNVLKVFRLLY